MTVERKELGRLVAVHPITPAYVQRAIFIAVLSFLFFMAMMFAFYLRQNIGYFLLATAFLLVYLVTMFSWISHRRSVVKVFERGIEYKSRSLEWDEVVAVSEGRVIVITPKDGRPIELPSAISEPAALARNIRSHIGTTEKA